MNSTTIERIMYYLACACMLLIAINHTAYSKGAYHMTWVLCGAVCMCSMLALRPKYRTTCWNAVKYGTAAVLPLVAVSSANPVAPLEIHWCIGWKNVLPVS